MLELELVILSERGRGPLSCDLGFAAHMVAHARRPQRPRTEHAGRLRLLRQPPAFDSFDVRLLAPNSGMRSEAARFVTYSPHMRPVSHQRIVRGRTQGISRSRSTCPPYGGQGTQARSHEVFMLQLTHKIGSPP